MKKTIKPTKVSKNPPPGWPSEEVFAKIEKRLDKSIATKVGYENDAIGFTKRELCAHFVRYLAANKITQRELAKRLSVTESRISEILHYHHERFTIDKLLSLLSVIKPAIRIRVA